MTTATRALDPHGPEGPFHEGEKALQARAGVRERAEQGGRRMIRDHMPAEHRELFEKLPWLLVGSVDASGQPWASVLAGPPGFVRTPDDRTMRVGALPGGGDPLRANLAEGAPLGLLGIEPHTRRRNRMNGSVVELDDRSFGVRVEQSFGNCPKYIHPREARWSAERSAAGPGVPQGEGALLSPAAQGLIALADTFFIASASPHARANGGAHGVDVSHRGLERGTLHLTAQGGAHVLTVPDYRGNSLFNTLGNLALLPRAGLLFVDTERGDTLQLACTVEVAWEDPELRAFPAAERLLRLRVERGLFTPNACPLRWSPA
jgi:hypothetical protein